jgi:hypothetical protein
VLFGRAPGGVGRTILCVERVDCPVPGRAGLSPAAPVLDMDIGWVVAVPGGVLAAGINPVGWGGLTEGKDPAAGGV